MAKFSEKRVLPYSCHKLFDMVADVERYPEFLPGWLDARLLSSDEEHAQVQQTLGIGPLQIRFQSRAEFRPPETIHILASDRPIQQLDIAWHFKSLNQTSCEITLSMTVRLEPMMFGEYLESWLSTSTSRILTAFERRAGQLYADSSHPQP